MDSYFKTFGAFIRKKRIDNGISLRKMAELMGYSATYWSDIENGRRNPPSVETLQHICEQLALCTEDEDLLFDLAGDFIQVPPPDLTDYLLDPDVRRALRTAKKHNVQADTWKAFEQSILDKS